MRYRSGGGRGMRGLLPLLAALTLGTPPALATPRETAPDRSTPAAARHLALIARFDTRLDTALETLLADSLSNAEGQLAWQGGRLLGALAEMLAATGEPRYAEAFVRLAEATLAARDDGRGRRDELRGRALPAWGSRRYARPATWHVLAVHTGLIAAPLAHFAAIVAADSTLTVRYAPSAARYREAARAALALHANQYRSGPGPDEGTLLRLGQRLPFNQASALARGWLRLAQADDAPPPARFARWARFLQHRTRITEEGALFWEYAPFREGIGGAAEDVAHAAINADVIVLCAEQGIVFGPLDLERLERTLLGSILRPDGTIAGDLSGGSGTLSPPERVLLWGRLARWRPAVAEALYDWLENRAPTPTDDGAYLLGLAHLVAASRSAPCGVVPDATRDRR